MPRIMVSAPFSGLMTAQSNGQYRFSRKNKRRIDAVHELLTSAQYELLSAHVADKYGEAAWEDDFVLRDLRWSAGCDVQLVLLPAEPTGEVIRSDGTMIELGFAFAKDKPVVILADDLENDRNSFFLRSFAGKHLGHCIAWGNNYEKALLSCLDSLINATAEEAYRTRQQRSDVDNVIAELRREERPHRVIVSGLPLTVLPGVLSPRLSHAPDALMDKWNIPSASRVLDLGCGSGILGVAALRAGAGHLVALDINHQAVKTTSLNLASLGLSNRGEARLSDVYSALRKGDIFDVILFAAPYWNRPAADDLERSCFDDEYAFFGTAVSQAHNWLAQNGTMYVIFSDQGDVGRALRIIEDSEMRVQDMHLSRPSHPGGHIRITWELRARKCRA
jgi:methylase of polypeptide subunit release factors